MQEGETCGRMSDGDGGVMTSDSACAGDLICGPYNGEELPVCVQPIALGEACDRFDTADCVDGAGCVDNVCTETLDDGEACDADAACTSELCVEGICVSDSMMCGG